MRDPQAQDWVLVVGFVVVFEVCVCVRRLERFLLMSTMMVVEGNVQPNKLGEPAVREP